MPWPMCSTLLTKPLLREKEMAIRGMIILMATKVTLRETLILIVSMVGMALVAMVRDGGLNGRRYISGEKIFQDCNESGFVVVQIEVDRSGKVIRAKAGEKGTTNKAPCLLEAARKSALTYRFNPDDKAPQTQIGFISMHFKLGENK